MKLLAKKIIAGFLCLSGVFMAMGSAGAFWPFSCDDSQKCKEKLEKSLAVITEKEDSVHEMLIGLYSAIGKLENDICGLKDAQITSEDIMEKLTLAYEEWRKDEFRIDNQSYTDYILLKKKFTDQNRIVVQSEQLVKDDMEALGKLLNTQGSKDEYVSSLKNSIDAYYKYSLAVAKEDMGSSEQE